jgi:hypothetical protein|tara:strand:+ start:1173 stop:1334 length:162 start_codon:yes stop_codon:yes gene_type:complete
MQKILEAIEVAVDTHKKIQFKGSTRTDELLYQFLGQILRTLKEDTKNNARPPE